MNYKLKAYFMALGGFAILFLALYFVPQYLAPQKISTQTPQQTVQKVPSSAQVPTTPTENKIPGVLIPNSEVPFSYPIRYGKITKEIKKANKKEDIGKDLPWYATQPNSVVYYFTDFPGDPSFKDFPANYIEIIKKEDFLYFDEHNEAYNFLKKVYEKKSIARLSIPENGGWFFGANIARKSKPTYIESNDSKLRGVYFFMRDGNGQGPDLSYNTVLLDPKGNIAHIQLFVWSREQEALLKEIDAPGSTIAEWEKKMDDFMNDQAFSIFKKEIEEVKGIVNTLKI